MKHLFIINPSAGKGNALKFIPRIHDIFNKKREFYAIEITKGPGHATELVKSYVAKDVYRVYSIGGDGTLNEVLNGIAGTESSLGIIPSGTGNDFIRNINSLSLEENILENTIYGEEKWIDLAFANGRYFINIASVGIDADIAYNARLFKNKPLIKGQLAYILSIFTTLHKYKSKIINIDIDGKKISDMTLLLGVANGKYYGGGMKLAPRAQLDDGLLDICHIKDLSKIKILFLFPLLIKGSHGSVKEVTFYKAKKVRITCNDFLSLNLDGEIQKVKEVEFKIIPKAVKIITPKD